MSYSHLGVDPHVVPVLSRHDDKDGEHRVRRVVEVGARHLVEAGGGGELEAEQLDAQEGEDEEDEGEEA